MDNSEFAKGKGKIGKSVEGAERLSLGLSIVIAILMGVGIGVFLNKTFHHIWLLWLGVFWGVAAAGLNIKIAYQKLKKELDEVKKDPKYKNYKIKKEDDLLDKFE